MGEIAVASQRRIFDEDSSACSISRYENYRLIKTSCTHWIFSSLFIEKSR